MQVGDSVIAELDETPSQSSEAATGKSDESTTKIPTHKKLCRVSGQVSHHRTLSADNSTGNKRSKQFGKRPHRRLVTPSRAVRSRHLVEYAVPWTHKSQHPKRHLDRFSRFVQLTRVPNTQTDTQTTLSRPYTGLIGSNNPCRLKAPLKKTSFRATDFVVYVKIFFQSVVPVSPETLKFPLGNSLLFGNPW